MKKILIVIVLLLAASASAQEVGKRAATLYAEKGYFTVEIPAGWEKADSAFGLPQEEKKVYGADFFAAADRDGLAPKILVHYYAQGNLLHKTADKYIRTHSQPVLGVADDGEHYGPVREGLVGKHSAKIFERNIFEYIPPGSINQKKIPVYEKFAVIPSKAGFYVLRLYSPGGISKANLKAYESVLASFKGIVAQTSSSLSLGQPMEVSAKQKEAAYIANFSFTPPSEVPAGSAGVSVAMGRVEHPSDYRSLRYKTPQFEKFDEAFKNDVSRLFAAKGFTLRGPFDSYDLIPYPDKKSTDLYMIPKIWFSFTSRGSSGDLPKGVVGIVTVKGKIILEAREIMTRELMWSKTIPYKDFEFPMSMITWETGVKESDVGDGSEKPVAAEGTDLMNQLAKGIEEQYPGIMTTIFNLIDPNEMRQIKRQAQGLKNKK